MRLRSLMMLDKRRMDLTHSSVAYISASAVLRAAMCCQFAFQWSGPR